MSNAMPKEKALHPEENKAVKAFAGIVDRGGMRCDSPALAPAAADPFEEAKEADPFEHHDDGSKSFETPWGRKCFVSGSGVEFTARGSTDRVKVCGPLEVVAEVRSDAGDDRRLLIQWLDTEGKEHQRLIQRADLNQSQKIFALLSAGGLRIDGQLKAQAGVASQIADYLNQYPITTRCLGVPSYGWYGSAGEVFVIPNGRIVASRKLKEDVIYTGPEEGAPDYSAKGTLEEWKAAIAAPAAYSSRAGFALCVAFAASVMAFTSEDSGGFHFYGESSRGKSTALRAMCSVWASAESGEMASWKTTDNGVEATFQARNALPVILDELGQAKSPKLMMELAYMIGNNKGKRRMSRNLTARKVASWKTLFVSSGELTVVDAASKENAEVPAGVLVRMAHIPALPFGDDPRGIFDHLPLEGECSSAEKVSDQLTEAAKSKTYGTAGPAFIEAVVDEVTEKGPEGFNRHLQVMMDQWLKNRGPMKDGQIGRVAKRFALVAAAGELAIGYGILPWQAGAAADFARECFEAWRANFKTPEEEEPELIAHFAEQVIANEKRFKEYWADGASRRNDVSMLELIGYLVVQGNESESEIDRAYIIPSKFALLCKGKTKQRTLAALSKRELLIENDKGRHVYKSAKGRRIPSASFLPIPSAHIVLFSKISG